MKKLKYITLASLPILIMIGFIPIIANDYILTLIYIIITAIGQYFYRDKHDILIYIAGFCFMLISETLFISTGVEIFLRNSLFGMMPLWLPFLWAYGFLAIRRAIHIIES